MAESIYKSVKPFYYFAKLTGFACFTIKGKATDGKIKTTIFDILLLIAFMLIPNLNVINDIYNLNRFLRIRHVMIYFYNVGSSLFVLQSFNQRLDLWNILRNIHEFDTGIQALGYSVNHKKHQRFVWIYILCTILLIIITLCLIMSRRTFEARTLLVYLSAIIIFIQFGSFQLSLVIANSKLNDFNMYLENIFLFRKKGFKHLRNKELGTHVIKTVKLYQILDDIISSINQSFSLVCLICFSLYFMFVILIVFSIFRVIYSDQNVLTPILLTTYSYIFLFYFLYVIGILIAANGITGKVYLIEIFPLFNS